VKKQFHVSAHLSFLIAWEIRCILLEKKWQRAMTIMSKYFSMS